MARRTAGQDPVPARRRTGRAPLGEQQQTRESELPEWFNAYVRSRRRLKRSPHTVAAIIDDFTAIGTLLARGKPLCELPIDYLTWRRLETAFANYADTHAANSCRRCRSTWNQLCLWLTDRDYLTGSNPMRAIEVAKSVVGPPKSLTGDQVEALVDAVHQVNDPPRSWPEMERAIIMLGVLAGPREAELLALSIADVRPTDGGAVLHIRGKGQKYRSVPIEAPAVALIDEYLRSREVVFGATDRRGDSDVPLRRFRPDDPLFVGADGNRLTRGSLSYRLRRAFKRAGFQPPEGALMHSLRHTYATSLADMDVGPYRLRGLLGHESLASTQRYIGAAGQDHRAAAATNPLYRLAGDEQLHEQNR